LVCDDGQVHPGSMPFKRMSPGQYANSVRDLFAGQIQPSAQFPQQNSRSLTGFSTEPDLNAVDDLTVELILDAAEDAAQQLPAVLPALLPCSSAPSDDCATTFIDGYGKRAFRRPLAADEHDNLWTIYTGAVAAGADFPSALAMVVDVLLQSPQFLYLPEIGTDTGTDDLVALTPYEIATRLSYLFWDSLPDDILMAAADNGELSTQDQVVAQGQRLLQDPRSVGAVRRFFREWTQVQDLSAASKDPAAFPQFSDGLAQSMGDSFDQFVANNVQGGGTLTDLLTSNKVMVDANLAAFFGMAPDVIPAGQQWAEVELDPATYAGIMTQPALLANLAHFSDTSYVFRGRFLFKGVMCQPLGDPPANALALADQLPLPANPTGRQRSEAVRSQSLCAGCHSLLDPLGLAFEKFDAVGQWHDLDEHGNAVDPSGQINYGQTVAFTGATDLMTQLAGNSDVQSCFDRQWYRFFAARMDADEDKCVLQNLDDAARAGGGSLGQIMIGLAQNDAFRYRKIPATTTTP
jgi:hypothetical protein